MDSKLYVGNLPFSTTEEELRALFGQAGTVTSATVMKDRDTGRSRGFAFVEMGSANEAFNAIKLFNQYSMGDRLLTVNIARPREERAGGGGGFGGGRSGGGGGDRRGGGSRGGDRRGGSGGGQRRY